MPYVIPKINNRRDTLGEAKLYHQAVNDTGNVKVFRTDTQPLFRYLYANAENRGEASVITA